MRFRISFPLSCVLLSTTLVAPAVSEPQHDLNWLTGCWMTETGRTAEHWSADPASGDLVGVGKVFTRSTNGSSPKTVFTEKLSIRSDGNRLVYIATPGSANPTRFIETSVESSPTTRSVQFENADHDYPQRIRYELSGSTVSPVLTATISKLDGSKQKSWVFSRPCTSAED